MYHFVLKEGFQFASGFCDCFIHLFLELLQGKV